jgi:hypothetical protein
MDLQNSASCVSNTVSTKGDNRVLMSKRFLKKSNTSYTAPKPRDLVFSQSTTPKSAIKQPRRHKRLPIDTVITANINEKYSKERIKSREEEEEEEESQETVRKIRQRLREKVVYELQKDFSKRNIKLSNEGPE